MGERHSSGGFPSIWETRGNDDEEITWNRKLGLEIEASLIIYFSFYDVQESGKRRHGNTFFLFFSQD